MYLLDINVWLALTFQAHVHHATAKSWFDSLAVDQRCHFCRHTQLGFLRLANNPKALPQVAVTQDAAWKLYDTIMAMSKVEFAAEPANLESIWRQFAQRVQHAPNLWADAYLAAFAVSGNFDLVTFDAGFKQFPGLALTILS
jgi:toxin-antitoxin system PIN domain toxin